MVAVTIEYIILGYEYSIDASSVGLGIGAYLTAISMIKEIQRILHKINNKFQSGKDQSSVELKILFSEFIELHAVTKQLSIKFIICGPNVELCITENSLAIFIK